MPFLNNFIKISFISIYFFYIFIPKIFSSPNCKSNVNKCYKCNPIKKLCELCNYPEVYSPDEFGGCSGSLKCIAGKNYCDKCDLNGELCNICEEGYVPDENGGCTYSPNCKISYKGECIECKKDFFLVGKKGENQICKSYYSEDFLNCFSITYETGLCNFCQYGYILTPERKCIKEENCQETRFGKCVSCKSGYYLNKINDTCEMKYDNLTLCKESIDNITCDICETNNYFDENGVCVPNKYCKNSISRKCVECIEGYFLTSENSVCTNTDNCLNGDKDLGLCMKCKDSFYLDTRDYKCKSNLEDNEFKYCIKVEEDRCLECKEEYYISEDSKCSLTKNCSESDLGKCIVCSYTFYLGYDNKCCDKEHCIYSSDNYCLECEDGFYYNRRNETCYTYDEDSIFNNCKYSCDLEDKCCKCKDKSYLNRNDSLCYSNLEYGPFYKCTETDEESKYCAECIETYFLGEQDYMCSKVEGCAVVQNEFRCSVCSDNYCLDENKGICIENDKVENDTYKIYFACNYTNEEGTACQQCLNGYEVNDEGYCVDVKRCIERENGNGVCLKCDEEYCSNDVFGCVKRHYSDCVRCNNLYDLYWCTECDKGFRINDVGGCTSEKE